MSEYLDNDIKNNEKKLKLRKMRFIATSLLILMTLVYFIFKRLEDKGLIFSSITAFAEASMIGALADWFAVVALFRHPLGLKWIPHTAIIQKNKDKIGESLSSFVVSNFFTEDIIRGKLQGITLTEKIQTIILSHKRKIAEKTIEVIPSATDVLYNNEQLKNLISTGIKTALKDIDVYSYLQAFAENYISSGMHTRVVKKLLMMAYSWVCANKDKTMTILEGINKTLALPIVGDMVYRAIIKSIDKLVDDINSGTDTEFNNEVLKVLPVNIIDELFNSEESRSKFERYKNEYLNSDKFDSIISENLPIIKENIVSYINNSGEQVVNSLENIIDSLVNSILEDPAIRIELESKLTEGTAKIICSYRGKIEELIRDTVDNWPMDDVVEKLETEVGGDLQYIRINGTVIGGLAGLVIHLISYFI